MACNSKTAGRIAKQTEIWEPETLITHMWCTFDLLVFKAILRSFGVLFSKWPVTQKQLAVQQNGLKAGNMGQ